MATGTDQALSFAAPLYPLDKVVFRPPPATVQVPKNVTPVDPVFTTTQLINPVGKYFYIDMQVSVDGNTWFDLGNEPFYFDGGTMLSFKRFASYWKVDSSFVTLGFTANDAAYALFYRLVGVSLE